MNRGQFARHDPSGHGLSAARPARSYCREEFRYDLKGGGLRRRPCRLRALGSLAFSLAPTPGTSPRTHALDYRCPGMTWSCPRRLQSRASARTTERHTDHALGTAALSSRAGVCMTKNRGARIAVWR